MSTPTDWSDIDPLIGVKTDLEIERMTGVSHASIAKRRKALGRDKGRRATKIDWEKWDYLIGLDSDEAVAAKIGCSKRSVFRRRKELGKPPAFPEYARKEE